MSEYIKKEDALKQQMLLWDDDGRGFMVVDVHRLNQLPTYSFPDREKGECISVPFDFDLFQAGLMDIPKGMTNGEIIQALFPNVSKYNNMLIENHSRNILFDDNWWNAPYKAESEE